MRSITEGMMMKRSLKVRLREDYHILKCTIKNQKSAEIDILLSWRPAYLLCNVRILR